MSSLLNAADSNSLFFNNYVTDVAVSMLFGLGYYLVKSIRNRGEAKNDKNEKIKADVKNKLEGALQRWNYAKTMEEYHQLIKTCYESCDPYEVLNIIVSRGLTPNIDTYNALLLNCYHNSNFSAANTLREEILDLSGPVAANNFTLNILIKGVSLQYKHQIKRK